MPKKAPERNAKGQFVKGCTKKGGRKPGTPNKYGNVRDRLKEIIMPYLETDPDKMDDPKVPSLAKDIARIDDPKDRADIISKFMPYLIPRYTSTTISADVNRPINEEERLLELDKQYTKTETTITLKQVAIIDNDSPSSLPPSSLPLTADYDPDEDDEFDIDSLT